MKNRNRNHTLWPQTTETLNLPPMAPQKNSGGGANIQSASTNVHQNQLLVTASKIPNSSKTEESPALKDVVQINVLNISNGELSEPKSLLKLL